MNEYVRTYKAFTRNLLDIIFPPCCAGCGKSGHVLCSSCIEKIPPLVPPLCPQCGTQLPSYGVCPRCQYHRLNLSGLRVVSAYQEPLRSYIHALKYEGNTRLAEPLGILMARAWVSYGLPVDMIVPVPLHSERQQRRGYNHAQLLAEVCAAQVQVPLHEHILIRTRATMAQVELAPSARYQNVAGAFVCNRAFATGTLYGRRILIIDDVCTTGATLEACAAPLFAAGAMAVWALVLARPQ